MKKIATENRNNSLGRTNKDVSDASLLNHLRHDDAEGDNNSIFSTESGNSVVRASDNEVDPEDGISLVVDFLWQVSIFHFLI